MNSPLLKDFIIQFRQLARQGSILSRCAAARLLNPPPRSGLWPNSVAFWWGDGAGEESAAPAAAVESACFGRHERGEGPCGGFAAAQAGGPRDAGA